MNFVDLVALLALVQLLVFGIFVGQARGKYGVQAPAITGHEMFERAYRVQMNTLELMILFVPSLYIAAKYWPASYMAGLGVVYLIGRVVYWRAYNQAPASRGTGFLLSFAPITVLLVAGIVGALRGAV